MVFVRLRRHSTRLKIHLNTPRVSSVTPANQRDLCCLTSVFGPAGSLIYEKLGERAFGWPGKMAAFMAIIMQNIGGRGRSLSPSLTCVFPARPSTLLAPPLAPCSHVQLPFHRQVRAARSDPSIPGSGGELWVGSHPVLKAATS